MTAEQLEELANGRNPSYIGLDCEQAITSLARLVIAAERLVDAGCVMADALKGHYIVPGSAMAWDAALTAYREAKG